ncbi:MAG: DUF1257 domain-containing protein [Polyangiaceae bacterium]|nr:DUF1257 domain-containing protein [Polyangiaceae bacterium]
MSHFVKIRTEIRERQLLLQALSELHHSFRSAETNELTVRGYAGNRERAEVVMETGSNYDIGFQRQEDHYEIVADWWGVEGNTRLRQQSFCQELNRQYGYDVVREQAREQDLVWEEERILENGDRVIVLSERG